ncbi:MAG: DNA-binding protein WhiA [Nitriliruptoraceae bacterium]|nr:DNA-binding protein WhiA [Nitriliruptoraceae bacterium]
MEPPGFTAGVRQELARVEVATDPERRAELSGLLRGAGSWHRDTAELGPRLQLRTGSGAVVRRAHRWLVDCFGRRPQLVVWSPSGVRQRTTYGLVVVQAAPLGQQLGLLDARGFPTDALPVDLDEVTGLSYLRGVVLASATISPPGRDPHLEMPVDGAGVADGLVALLAEALGVRASHVDGDRRRVVIKSGESIGRLLATLGASQAFLAFDDRRLRRQLRAEANRLANADNANLRRSIEAAAVQVRAVETAIAAHGWDGLPEELRDVALVRLANPEASLSELGALLHPGVGKSAVHRRLRRLEELAADPPAATDEGEAESP